MKGYYEFLSGLKADPKVSHLNEVQLRVLARVAGSDPDGLPNLTCLAHELDITHGTMARAADRLAAEGLVEQIRGKKNGVHLKLTAKGSVMHQHIGRMFTASEAKAPVE